MNEIVSNRNVLQKKLATFLHETLEVTHFFPINRF